MKLFPPTGIEYVATSAKGLADKITLLDLRYEKELSDTEKLLNFIRSEIDIICVSVGWDRQLEEVKGLLRRMPAGIPLIVGGYKATEQVEELFRDCPNIDVIVRGEGEESMKEILERKPLDTILGVSYKENGKVIHNKHRPLPNVDTLSYPDRSLRRHEYHLTLGGVDVTKMTFDSVLSARGCPYTCKFCTFSLNPLGQKRNYAPRSVESVVEEIEKIKADGILFSDDNFFANPKRAEEICDLIIARKINKRFIAQARIEIAKYPALLEKMVKAGFKILLMGIESPHDRILAQLNKGFDSDTIRKYFSVLRKYPLYYHGYFIYGNITETEKEMLYIAEFAKEIGLDSITFQKLRIEKFSPLREIAESTPGYHVTDIGAVYSDTFSHATLKKIGKRIKFSFYTGARLIQILKKCFRVKLFTSGEVVSFLVAGPLLLKNVIAGELHKKRLVSSLKQIVLNNKPSFNVHALFKVKDPRHAVTHKGETGWK
ncbi:MAG: radical SAM protein [Candidatus Omnitrophota bacterium]|nr:radical SAM protein [Candidatus Omnitrophota bacterium]